MCRECTWWCLENQTLQRIAFKHVYYHRWNKSPVQVWCMRQGTQGWCTGMTLRDGMGRVVGRRLRMGNTCTPMADSCQCMAKPLQYKKEEKKKENQTLLLLPTNLLWVKKKKKWPEWSVPDKTGLENNACQLLSFLWVPSSLEIHKAY